jgi:methyltransferase small domain
MDGFDKYVTLLKVVFINVLNKKIIECGCGTGKISTYCQNKGYSVTAVDIDDEILHLAKNIVKKIII